MRAVVYLIDMALVGAAAGVIGGPLTLLVAAGVGPMLVRGDALGYLLIVLVPLLIGVAFVIAYVAMQGSGGSLAQRWFKVRLVRADSGGKIGFWRALGRHVIWGLATGIVVGYFSVFFDRSGRRQGWHDKVVKSLVVDVSESRSAAPAAPQSWQPDPRLSGAPAPAAPAHPGAPAGPYAAPQPPAPEAGVGQPPAPGAAQDPFAAPAVPPRPADPVAAPQPPVAPAPTAPPQSTTPAPSPQSPAADATIPPAPRDPFAEPARTEQDPTQGDDGPIAFVPGVTGERPAAREPVAPAESPAAPPMPEAPAAPPAAAPPAPSEPAAPPVPPATEAPTAQPPADDFPDDTVVIDRSTPRAPAGAVLVWDDGRRTLATARTLFGRNPVAEDGAEHVAIVDDSLSLSKTHFEIAVDGDRVTIIDRHSTNGVVLERDGVPTDLAPGVPADLASGDVLLIGDRRATVESAGRA